MMGIFEKQNKLHLKLQKDYIKIETVKEMLVDNNVNILRNNNNIAQQATKKGIE